MTQVVPHNPDMDALEILRLYASGQRLSCRYCNVELRSIPEQLRPGEQPTFLQCPNNPNHMTLFSDSAKGMREVHQATDRAPEWSRRGLTIHSSRSRFAARLNSGVMRGQELVR